jgi:hypothetical protein
VREYGITRFAMDSGERYCLVVDRLTGLPLYYPNLYLLTQLRNRSVALATIEAEASHLVVLLRYLFRRKIDLEARFSQRHYFQEYELDDLRDFSQRKQRKLPVDHSIASIFSPEELEESTKNVKWTPNAGQ